MIYRRLITSKLPTATVNSYSFGVDAKNITIGVPKEVYPNEKRVSITPDTIQRMVKKNGINFIVESGAGL